MALIKGISSAESIERIKAEIVRFLEVRYSNNYQGEDADGEYKGTNFNFDWASYEIAEIYVPTPGLTLNEIWEVINYIEHYGYFAIDENGNKVYKYKGILKDWDGYEIAMRNVWEREGCDENKDY